MQGKKIKNLLPRQIRGYVAILLRAIFGLFDGAQHLNGEVMIEPPRVPGDHNLFICSDSESAKKE
jgi:hypothetical protein